MNYNEGRVNANASIGSYENREEANREEGSNMNLAENRDLVKI